MAIAAKHPVGITLIGSGTEDRGKRTLEHRLLVTLFAQMVNVEYD